MKIEPHMVTTTFDLPGYKIVKTLGIARGVSARAVGTTKSMKMSFQGLFEGEISSLRSVAVDSLNEAQITVLQHAEELGANAIVGFRYVNSRGINIAYGTAVIVELIK